MNAGLRRREVVLAAHEVRAFDATAWHDVVVVVEQGVIELETPAGARRRFGPGTVLCFAGLPLRALRNTGAGPATLIAISRRSADSFSADASSYRQEPHRSPESDQPPWPPPS